MDNSKMIESLERLIQEEYDKLEALEKELIKEDESFDDYMDSRNPHYERIAQYGRKKRMLMTPEYSEIPNYGQLMSIKDFKSACKSGLFVDYDGSGNYVKDDKMSNIDIYPSDVTHNSIRKDFDTIIWFNR